MAIIWSWHRASLGGGGPWSAYPGWGGVAPASVPAGHTLQRVIANFHWGGLAKGTTANKHYNPLPFLVFNSLSVIGEPGGPRVLFQRGGPMSVTWAYQPPANSPDWFIAAYSPGTDSVDMTLRVANPNVNGQPVDVIWEYGGAAFQGSGGTPDVIGPDVSMVCDLTILTTHL